MLNDEEDDVEDEESDDEYEKYDVVLKEIGEESGLGRSNKYWWEKGEKSDINEDYDASDNESDIGIDYEDDEDDDMDDDDNDDVRDSEKKKKTLLR